MERSKSRHKKLLSLLLLLAMVMQLILSSVYAVSAADDSIADTYGETVEIEEVTDEEPNESEEITILSPMLFASPLAMTAAGDRSADFKIDTLKIKVDNKIAYEYAESTETISKVAIDLSTDPRVDFEIAWSQVDPDQMGFWEGDYILFKICEVTGSPNAEWANLTSDKPLYDGNAKLAIGSLVAEQTDSETITLYYKITFTENIEGLNEISGTMTGGANIKGLEDYITVTVEHESNSTAEVIAEINKEPNTSTGSTSGSGIPNEFSWFSTYKFASDKNENPISWQLNAHEFFKKSYADYEMGVTPVYEDLIVEDILDIHQTFNMGDSCHIGTIVFMYDTETAQTFWPNGRQSLSFGKLVSQGIIKVLDTEAEVRNTPLSYAIITEPDPSNTSYTRQRLILNLGAPGSTGMRYGDLLGYDNMKKRVNNFLAEYLRFTDMIATAETAGYGETDPILELGTWTDSNGNVNDYTLELCRRWQRIYYFSYDYYNVEDEIGNVIGPYIYGYEVYLSSFVDVTKLETIMTPQVTNSYKFSGGFTESAGTAKKVNFWSGTISAKRRAVAGEVQIFKADSLYRYEVENIQDELPTSGYIGYVQFEVYKKNGEGPLEFHLISGTTDEDFGTYRYKEGGGSFKVTTGSTDGSIVLTHLDDGDYYLKEVGAPSSYYSGQNQEIEFTVTSGNVTYILAENVSRGVTLKKVKADDSVLNGAIFELYSYTKDDYSDAVKLTGFTKTTINGTVYLVYNGTGSNSLRTENGENLTIVQLPAGKYYLKEASAPTGYMLSDEKYPFVLTDTNEGDAIIDIGNIKNYEATSQTVTKVWDDANNQDGIRLGRISVQLYKHDASQDSGYIPYGDPVILSVGNSLTYTWGNLPLKNAQGQKIEYDVKEVSVLEGYTVGYSDNVNGSIIITNSHTAATVGISVQKEWDDKDNLSNSRPDSITLNLWADGKIIDSQEVSENDSDDWEYQWVEMPKYKKGVEINYTVTEEEVKDYQYEYTKAIDDNLYTYNLTNSYTLGFTSRTVEKIWNDVDNQDGIRPTSITVQLKANNSNYESPVTLSGSNNWTYTWNDLPVKLSGEVVEYTVEEIKVPSGYSVSYDTDGGYSIIVINDHTPVTVDISGMKTWDDENDRYGRRPNSITVNLLANGKVKDSKMVSGADWRYSWTALPKYESGAVISYTITENAVSNYKTTINGYNITNTYTPDNSGDGGSSSDPDPVVPKDDVIVTPEPPEETTTTSGPPEETTTEPSEETTTKPEIVLPDGYEDYEGGEIIPLGKDNPNNDGLTAIRNRENANEYLILDDVMAPLGTIIVPEGMEIDEIDVLDNLIPLGAFSIPEGESPKTGDILEVRLLSLIGTAVLAGVLITLLSLRKRRA